MVSWCCLYRCCSIVIRSNVAAVLFWIFSIVLETDLLVPTDGDRLEIVSSDEFDE